MQECPFLENLRSLRGRKVTESRSLAAIVLMTLDWSEWLVAPAFFAQCWKKSQEGELGADGESKGEDSTLKRMRIRNNMERHMMNLSNLYEVLFWVHALSLPSIFILFLKVNVQVRAARGFSFDF